MIKKVFILFFLIINFNELTAQSSTNVEDVFKMHLFLNKKNVVIGKQVIPVSKNDSLYKVFSSLITLKIDTLKVTNNLTALSKDSFCFYKLSEEGITENRKLTSNESNYLTVNCSFYNFFVLAINNETGATYKMLGFDTNDCLNFISDFIEIYYENNSIKLSTSKFLKNYHVDSVDLECLFKGLRSKQNDREKYPCLRRCSEPIVLYNE